MINSSIATPVCNESGPVDYYIDYYDFNFDDPCLVYETGELDHEFFLIFDSLVGVLLNGFLSLTGIVNNIITIIVFNKMGYKETSNITMTAIAFWDLVRALLYFLISLDDLERILQLISSRDWILSISTITNFLFDHLADLATRTSGVLTAYVAIERCLCVSLPFTVKFLLTRKSVTITCLTISLVLTGLRVLYFGGFKFGFVRDSWMNATYFTWSGKSWLQYNIHLENAYAFFYRVILYATPCTMIVCTAIITYNLSKSSKFRSRNKKDKSTHTSSREMKTTKMLLVIVVVYIVYFIPVILNDVWDKNDSYEIDYVLHAFISLLAMLNSLINIYIFYVMSSGFKRTMKNMFCLGPIQDQKHGPIRGSSKKSNKTNLAHEGKTAKTQSTNIE